MEITAKVKSVIMSPRKVRLVADTIKNMSAIEAVNKLSQIEQRAAGVLTKTLKSAMANAKNNANMDVDTLVIKQIQVLPGSVLKRFHPASRGRAHPYKKRSSHITVTLMAKGGKK